MNIKFCKGTHRTALLLGPITIKFVRFDLFSFLKYFFNNLGKKNYSEIIKADFEYTQFGIIKGMFANITEFLTWRTLKASFLAPTYFSCGFFNIQKTVIGEELNCVKLMRKVFDNLSEQQQKEWCLVEKHSLWTNSGWIKTSKGIFLFDYGDCFLSGLPFSNILSNSEEEIEKTLSQECL